MALSDGSSVSLTKRTKALAKAGAVSFEGCSWWCYAVRKLWRTRLGVQRMSRLHLGA